MSLQALYWKGGERALYRLQWVVHGVCDFRFSVPLLLHACVGIVSEGVNTESSSPVQVTIATVRRTQSRYVKYLSPLS
jgi:hypothetical protein